MANSNTNTTPVAFSGTSTISTPKALNSTSRFEFDAITIHADTVRGSLLVTLDNPGTPASGDYVDLWIKYSTDGTNYPTDEHATRLGRMNTYGSDDPGEDPCTQEFKMNVSGAQKFKLVAKSNQSTRQITLAAIFNEHRMA